LFAPPWGGSGGLGGGLCFPLPTPGIGSKRAGWRRSGAVLAFFGAVCFEPDAGIPPQDERATSRPIAEIRIRIGGAVEAIWQRIAHAIATFETATENGGETSFPNA
jgi:hypothetical protein